MKVTPVHTPWYLASLLSRPVAKFPILKYVSNIDAFYQTFSQMHLGEL